MSFNPATLNALIQGNGFSLWQYRTADSRAAVTAAGYFALAAGELRPGDLMVLQAADAVALLPIRIGPALGTGVTLDGVIGPLNTFRGIAQRFAFTGRAAALVRGIVLGPLVAGVVAGGSLPVSAMVTGPIAQVVFRLLDGSGQPVPPAQTIPVAAGRASTSFPARPVGTGYRITAADADNPALAVSSPSFGIGPDLALLLGQEGQHLLTEAGGALKQ